MAITTTKKMQATILKSINEQLAAQMSPRLHMYYGTEHQGVRDVERQRVHSSAVSTELLRPFFSAIDHREEFWILLLDRGNKTIGVVKISEGGIHGTVADPKVIFGAALVAQATAMIVAHNHPSGQLRPSEEDIRLTRKLVEAGRLLDIQVLDHNIITKDGYYSFADNGQLN
jgi:DNA repair protein RadC